METYFNNFESAKEVIDNTKNDRKEWHQKEQTLTKLLHRAQSKEMLPITSRIFKEVGLPTNGKLSKTKYLTYVQNFVTIKGEKVPAYLREVKVYEKNTDGTLMKDADGKNVCKKDAKGDDVKELRLTAIKAGTWTLEKLLKAVAM